MKPILAFMATLIACFSFAQAKLVSSQAKAKAEQEILAFEEKVQELGQKSDFKGLAEFIERNATDNCTFVHGDGRVEAKAEGVKGLRAVAEKKDPNLSYETYKYEEKEVEVYGDAAILSAKGTWRTQGEAKAGKAHSSSRFTHFFVKQDGEWKLARIHVTHLPAK